MVLIDPSEIVILLGFISVIKFQMDLPTIPGLIAVLVRYRPAGRHYR